VRFLNQFLLKPKYLNKRVAARAYRQALSTLATLTAHPPAHRFDPSLASGSSNTKSLLSTFLPNLQGQGPVGSVFRIVMKLQQHTLRRITYTLGREGLGLGSRRKEEEMRGKAIKVVDLLQHSAELGNNDALYMLAQIYLVCAHTRAIRSSQN
jgi:SEL1 protein